MNPSTKIRTHEQVDDWVMAEKVAGHKIGFTCGSFDLLHPGHVQYLAKARELCDGLIVAVNTDESVRLYKSPLRPVNPEQGRMYVLAGLESVDIVTRLEEKRPLNLLLRWKPDLYIKGGDYDASALRSGDAVREYGGEVVVVRPEYVASSSGTIERKTTLALHAVPEEAAAKEPTGLVLLDRDGTLIRDVPFLHEPEKVELGPGVLEGLRRLQDHGYRFAIVSNQQGIGLGYFTTAEFIAVNQRLLRELGAAGIRISKIYFCPHTVADECGCRKPKTGMIDRAMRDFGMPADRTYLIGDTDADRDAGAAAGVRTFILGPGTTLAGVAAQIAP